MAVVWTPNGFKTVPDNPNPSDQVREIINKQLPPDKQIPPVSPRRSGGGGGGNKKIQDPRPYTPVDPGQQYSPAPPVINPPTPAPTTQDLLRTSQKTVPPTQVPGVKVTDYEPIVTQLPAPDVYYSSSPGWVPKNNPNALVVYTDRQGKLTGQTSQPSMYDLSEYSGERVDTQALASYIKENPPSEIVQPAPTYTLIEPEESKRGYELTGDYFQDTMNAPVTGVETRGTSTYNPSTEQFEVPQSQLVQKPMPIKPTDLSDFVLSTGKLLPTASYNLVKKLPISDSVVLTSSTERQFFEGGTGVYNLATNQVTAPITNLPEGFGQSININPSEDIAKGVKFGTEMSQYLIPVYGTSLLTAGMVSGTGNIISGIKTKQVEPIITGVFEVAPGTIFFGAKGVGRLIRPEIKLIPRGKPTIREIQLVKDPVKFGDKTFIPVSSITSVKYPAEFIEKTTMLKRIFGRPSELIQISKPGNYRITGEFLTKGNKSLGIIARGKAGSPSQTLYIGMGKTGSPLSKGMNKIDQYVLGKMIGEDGLVPLTKAKLKGVYSQKGLTQKLFTYNVKTGKYSLFAKKLDPQFGFGISSKLLPTKYPNINKFLFGFKSGKSMYPIRRGAVQRGIGLSITKGSGDGLTMVNIGRKSISKLTSQSVSAQTQFLIPKPRTNLMKIKSLKESPKMADIKPNQLNIQVEDIKPKSLQIVKEQPKVLEMGKTSSLSASTLSKSSSILKKQSSASQSKQKYALKELPEMTMIEKLRMNDMSKFKMATSSALRLKTKTKLDSNISLAQYRKPIPTKIPSRIKIPKPDLEDEEIFKKISKKSKGKAKFIPEVRRKGKFFSLAAQESPQKAITAGKIYSEQTLGASFRVKGPKGYLALQPTSSFRFGKRNPTILVQQKTARLGSFGERREIIQSRKGGFGF